MINKHADLLNEIDDMINCVMKPAPEFMIRVKLPSSGAYAACPSGDNDYDEAYRKAIAEALPGGFEIIQPRLNQKNPQDSEGFTWMRIKYVGENAMTYWMQECQRLQNEMRTLQDAIKKLPFVSVGI